MIYADKIRNTASCGKIKLAADAFKVLQRVAKQLHHFQILF